MLKPIEDTLIWRGMEKLMRGVLVICSVLLVLVIGTAVFMRYIMDSVFFGSEEILALLATWLYWVGGSYGSYEDSHISADMTNLFIRNDRVRGIFKIIVRFITVVITGTFAYWATTVYLINNIEAGTVTTALRIPYITSKVALSVGFVLMFLYAIYHFIRSIHPRKDVEQAEQGGEAP